MSLIQCHNVALGYEGTTVLTGVNFQVYGGDYICIVGENGSGKSTLMKGILNLKSPISGTINMGDGLRADEIGYLPQVSTIQKDFPASVFEVVLSGRLNSCRRRAFYSALDKQAAMENMKRMGLGDMKNHSFQELSVGQQRRVLLARALCATKKLLLLDEPAAGLDPLVTNDLYHLIKRINQESSIAVVMVSHDLQSAIKHSSHILHLDRTQLFFGPTGDYRKSDLCSGYLGGSDDV